MEQDRFKADVLVYNDDVGNFLFMADFNVPEESLYDGSLPTKLNTIRTCIVDEFQMEILQGRVLYSVSASYRLFNVATGEERLWTGSFQPRANRSTQLRPFRRFAPDNFLAEAAVVVQPAAVSETLCTLDLLEEDTKWTYQGLKSAIYCFQARCRHTEHPFSPSLLVPQQRIAKLLRDRATKYKLYLDN